MSHKYTNSLIHASSPYLLQHAHNPVNWVEWTEEALQQAQRENKLIIVSIGYSSCHWCHVMERESFENEETATIMNTHFVCIKVDREERPDLDQTYMDAVQLLTGRGGWPLNMIALPDGRPLHGGTYFPKKDWDQTLLALNKFFKEKPEEAEAFAKKLSAGIVKQDVFIVNNDSAKHKEVIQKVLAQWQDSFDIELGGYRWAPKFPLPNQWMLFLDYHALGADNIYKEAVFSTLYQMATGGIFDQIGGGFSRYSTDSYWKVPHFEKMLYDNAQLMELYAAAYVYFKEPLFLEIIEKTNRFIEEELMDEQGRFYSALDADSEGEEGKYYIWTQAEMRELLGKWSQVAEAWHSVTEEGNWENGVNILHRTAPEEAIAQHFNLSQENLKKIIDYCNEELLVQREKRVYPGLDDKVICSWNALMIKGYAKAAYYTNNKKYLETATDSMDLLLQWACASQGLMRIYKDGKVSIAAFAEDYATLIDALICLYETGLNETYLLKAHELAEECLQKFGDPDTGLLFFTSNQQAAIINRKVDCNDDVIPSSNSIMAINLLRLSYYFDRFDFEEKARTMLASVINKIEKYPNAYSNWINLALQLEHGLTQIILTGPLALEWKQKLSNQYLAFANIFIATGQETIPFIKGKAIEDGNAAYVCKGRTCSLPIRELDTLIRFISQP